MESEYESGTELGVEKKHFSAKEVPVIQDQGFFTHATGDTYEGYFEARKKEKSLRMQGPGSYKTAEGDVYKGVWDNDKLGTTEEVSISYHDGARYEGQIKDWCYSGVGKYSYPDSSIITCNFLDNCPLANMELVDPNGHTWLAKADAGFAWFDPVNHFYEFLEKTRDYERIKRRSTSTKSKVEAEEPPETPGKKKNERGKK